MITNIFDNEDGCVTVKFDPAAERLLVRLVTALETLNQTGVAFMSALDDLTTQVAQNTSVEASAVTLIQGLAQQIAAAGTNPTALVALQNQLLTSANALSAAITANTPATPQA